MATHHKTEANGVEVFQVTSETDHEVSNIYCERPFTSADSKRFLYARQVGTGTPGRTDPWDYILCSMEDWSEAVVGRGRLAVTISYNSDYYILATDENGQNSFIRIDLDTGTSETVYTYPEPIGWIGHPAVGPDGRHIAYHRNVSYDPVV